MTDAFYYDRLYRARRSGRLGGDLLEILRLLQRARGSVTERLLHYQVWQRRGRTVPMSIHDRIAHLRVVTGLGIARDQVAGWRLVPALDETWCEQEKWRE